MRIRFLDVAQRELDDAVAWYSEREEDLGLDFLDELDRSIRRILSFPLASTEIDIWNPEVFVSSLPVRHHLRTR